MANVNFILDEAASLGPNMGCVEDAIDKYRGYGVKLQLYYQSTAQLKKCFPNDQDQNVLANVSQVFFAANDLHTAEYISNRLGDQTITVESGGTSSGYSRQSSNGQSQGSTSYSSNANDNWNQMSRRLLKPEEVLSLSERVAITFAPGGVRPVWTLLERYYEKKQGHSPTPEMKALWNATRLVVLMTIVLFLLFKYVEKTENEQTYPAIQTLLSRPEGGGQTPGATGSCGTGERPVQWDELRTVRRRPEVSQGSFLERHGLKREGTGEP